jgi:hypothetical protein
MRKFKNENILKVFVKHTVGVGHVIYSCNPSTWGLSYLLIICVTLQKLLKFSEIPSPCLKKEEQ